ncbi:MAG: TetR/AcrR family transcriptional regulator [Pseudomonadota bacterium]
MAHCGENGDIVEEMTAQTAKKRQRLSPEKRRALILDYAANVIARDGVAGLSMEGIGKEAGVSKSLVYNYFENLTELMRELLDREFRALRRRQAEAADKAETFEGLVRGITHEYLKYIEERGLIIERLQAEPSVSKLHDPTDYSRDAAVGYLADIIAKHCGLPIETARAATDISFGLPASAGEYLLRKKIPREEIEDLTVSMIIGCFSMVRMDDMIRSQPLRRDSTSQKRRKRRS